MASRRLAEIADHARADIVQVHCAALAAGRAFAQPVVAVHHSCVATWWAAMRGGPLPADFAWRTALTSRGLAAADATVAPSQSFALTVMSRYGLARPPTVIRNGALLPAPTPIGGRERFALTAGRLWDEAKGAAWLDAATDGSAIEVRAAGAVRGPDGATFAPRSLRLLGRLDAATMRREIGRAGAFISLARYEPFGLGVLEAAAAGCPLVLADIDAFRELWDGAASFVDPTDIPSVRTALSRMMDDQGEANRLSVAARRRAEDYPLSATTGGFLALYRDVLDARASVGLEASA